MSEFYVKLMLVTSFILVPVIYVAFGPSTVSIQRGYEGVGMDHVYNKDVLNKTASKNVPPPKNPLPLQLDGERAAVAYQNVQVLGGLSQTQFNRLMISLTQWVSPEEKGYGGCNYCHNPNNMASDEKYTKHVARRMLQMTQHINENWKKHVKQVGVTCYTCHRGQPVPEYIWYNEPRNEYASRLLGNPMQQNKPGYNVGLASLPSDPFTPYLEEAEGIRVVGGTALPTGNRSSIKQTEWTYGLMIHMSNSLNVNCTYCHNSRAFAEWKQSPPARTTAWYGIRMVRDINGAYTKPLLQYYPENRKGPMGDAPKANCKTCHQGAYKPLLGAQMVKDYPGLQKSTMYVPPPPPKDTDGDGMLDDDDKCPNDAETKNGFQDSDGCVDTVPQGLETVTGAIEGLAFNEGSSTLSAKAQGILRTAARTLNKFKALKVEVQAHVDGSLDAEAAKTLTQAQAEAVMAFLTQNGVEADRISAMGYGSAQPRSTNDTEEGRAQNRRIEFSLE
ncbi:MAG: photosynthetic reaction center cytochrome PufC [Myxococcota bacterium]